MASLWGLGGLTWKDLGRRVWGEIQKDDVFGRSAQLAYYFLLALIPFLLFLTSVIGIILGSGTGLRHSFFNYLSQVLPGDAFKLVDSTMYEVSAASGGGKVAFGIVAALWAASNGMGAITDSLNAAYDVEETRPWWRQRLTAVALTVALSFLIIAALVLVLYGGRIAEHVAGGYGLDGVFVIAWEVLQWPIALAFMLVSFALIYYFAPDLHDQDWTWITPGSAVGVGLWLLVSFGFRVYLHFFDSYSKTYGSLGAVIVLMLWLYLTGAAILIGGEVNSEIEDAAAKAGAPDAKEKGEKAPEESEPKTRAEAKTRVPASRPVAAFARRGVAARSRVINADESELTFGKVATVFGAWCLGLLHRTAKKQSTIHR
ncbi:MAG TPA: YihY/virulence factor BrkB family protein [Pyrinomonadaceae bacterium]|jgi:membrane protein|nr:YihY/virulence factor BrkB family protein [Pyrinomonadaceae bacterium]